MSKAKRIFFVADTKEFTDKLLKNETRRQVKGFVRLGHDAQVFNYRGGLYWEAPLMSRILSKKRCKRHVDDLLVRQVKNYSPDVVHVSFANFLDADTVQRMRHAAPSAFFIGRDIDLWPELHKDRLEAATRLDVVMTTYDGEGLRGYRDAGVRCIFVPNSCDPDIEYRYEVSDRWKSDILFTGQTRYRHKRYPTEDMRHQLLSRLVNMQGCALYGCYGRPRIGGINYLYAISGAKIGLSANAANDIRLYHSDRLTTYLACGTFVLAKRVPDSDLLFKDGEHLRYFDTVEEFFELAGWHLKHEQERQRIAKAGMERAHGEFNCQKMAKYTLDIIEMGCYIAPWTG